MRNEWLRALLGAGVVYVAMAACSAEGGGAGPGVMASGGSGGGPVADAASGDATGGAMGTGGGQGGSGVVDAALDMIADVFDAVSEPVPGAEAAPGDTVVMASCDVNVGGTLYAVGDFPGRPVEDLARVYAIAESPSELDPGGFSHTVSHSLRLRPSGVALVCGSAALPAPPSVQFVLPAP